MGKTTSNYVLQFTNVKTSKIKRKISSERVSHAGSWGLHWLRGPVSTYFGCFKWWISWLYEPAKRNSAIPSHFKIRAYFFHNWKDLQFWKQVSPNNCIKIMLPMNVHLNLCGNKEQTPATKLTYVEHELLSTKPIADWHRFHRNRSTT